ncbi:glycosyl transferase family group 2-domain-containing protein, partial [Suillus subluteus]
MDYDPYDALLHHVYQQTQGEAWFRPTEETIATGVCLRVAAGHYRVFPYNQLLLAPFEAAVRLLNPVVAVKIRSAAVHAAFSTITDTDASIYIDSDTKIQVFDSMNFLPRAEKEQCAAFIRDERVIVIWSDSFDTIIPLCRDLEEKLIKLVWRFRHLASPVSTTPPSTNSVSVTTSAANLVEKDRVLTEAIPVTEKERNNARTKVPPKKSRWAWSWRVSPENRSMYADEYDLEKEGSPGSQGPRPLRLYAPFYCGLATALSIFFIGSGLSVLLAEWLLDDNYTRFILLVTSPFLFCISLFFCLQLVGNLTLVLGPVAQYHENSRYYSAVPPSPNKAVDAALPHITVELPVFKESLEHTIAPSVFSIKKAMQTYARQGGTSAIFVHDDGLQLISTKEQEERIAFYADHNIGWVARPKHDSVPGGFKRAGRFKKASNMNYGLALSLKLEKHLKAARRRGAEGGSWMTVNMSVLKIWRWNWPRKEVYNESGGKWRPWANNGKSLRIGEIILIVDADTIVPEDCFRDAARELAESPDVGIIQHESDVMQVAHHYFENGIAHFTRRINKCISIGCANGEVAPFVGHNAFLRWSALQDAAFIDPADGKKKIWSESNVSEDFDMALRLQLKHYSIRWASYSKGGFKEGVSLTVDDELNRWQKYSYVGCNELIFNPLIHWWKMGPIAKQLRIFVWSGAPVHYKLTMMAYMFSYYGIAAAAILSLVNYLLLGFQIEVDGFFLHSFEVWLACTVVFPGVGNLGFSLLEYRLGHRNLLASAIENVTWIPFFFFFFGGLSIHLSQALLSHLFSYNITWGATKKEVERSNFFIEVPKILKRFRVALILCTITVAGMIILSTSLVPVGWQVESTDWAVILPLAIVVGSHILFPIVLNPWLMIFSY